MVVGSLYPELFDGAAWRLADLVDQDVLVACGHYRGDGVGRIARRDGRVVWVAGG